MKHHLSLVRMSCCLLVDGDRMLDASVYLSICGLVVMRLEDAAEFKNVMLRLIRRGKDKVEVESPRGIRRKGMVHLG